MITFRITKSLLLLASCCILLPAQAFLLPSSLTRTRLHSTPDQPGDWFRSESSDITGGASLTPLQNDPFIVSPEGGRVRPKQPQGGRAYYPEKKPNIPPQRQPKDYYPQVTNQEEEKEIRRPKLPNIPNNQEVNDNDGLFSPYEEWKRQDDRPGVAGHPSYRDNEPKQKKDLQEEWQDATGFAKTKARPSLRFPSEDSRKDRQEAMRSRYQPKEEERQPPFEGHLTTGFSSTPDQPGAWFQSEFSSSEEDQPPRRTTRVVQPRPPQEIMEPYYTQEPAPRSKEPKIPYQPFSQPKPEVGERRPNIPRAHAEAKQPNIPKAPFQFSPRQTINFPKREGRQPISPQQQQMKRPVIPRTTRPDRRPAMPDRNEHTVKRPTIPRMDNNEPQRPLQDSRQSKIPQRPFSDRGREEADANYPQQQFPQRRPDNAPFQIENVERYSATPIPMQPQARREQQAVRPREARAVVRERAPDRGFPQREFPQPAHTGAIMPLEPSFGGPLGPNRHSYDGPGSTYSSTSSIGSAAPGRFNPGRQRGEEVVQGAGSRKTWSTSHHDQTILEVGSEGRPVFATAQVWQGPNNTPASMKLYSEDGAFRPWKAAFQNSGRSGESSVLDVRNDGPMEFPMDVSVVGKHDGTRGMAKEQKKAVEEMEQGYDYKGPSPYKVSQTVQGQSLKYFNVEAGVPAVLVELCSEGRPMFVQVELWQGPNAIKQCAEVYSDNGNDRHWSAIIDTHGRECTVAVRNIGPALVYPIKASVDPIV